ncbi:MAG: glycoside hydrolase family 3 protein [Acholeplasmataceae bacterium]|jgi:beta-glucosidase|nr:glycoside hydrolase family 3 protein [Acholeplasmataceae bacterium]
MKKILLFALLLFTLFTIQACIDDEPTDPTVVPTDPTVVPSDPTVVPTTPVESSPDDFDTIEAKVAWWIDHMTIEEKAGQMIQAERSPDNGGRGATSQETTFYRLGSILNGGGNIPGSNTVSGWRQMVRTYQNASKYTPNQIPLLYGVDAVHGHNNLVNSTIFPHNIGLAAANNPELMYQIGERTAYEVAQTTVNMNFSPSIGIVKDVRWGRTYETLGEDPERAVGLISRYIEGIQMYNIAGTAKHFVGDGYTTYGTGMDGGLDRGNSIISMDELYDIHLPLYEEAILAGVKSVMISYSSINGLRMHESKQLVTDILKTELGFEGFVISDYEATNDVTGANFEDKIINTINAGIDMLMEPNKFDQTHQAILNGYHAGEIDIERINDAVSRILAVKYEIGLFDPELTFPDEDLRSEESLAVARQAVRESLVLLKNENDVLPLSKSDNLLVVGPGSDNLGIQSGGWTLTWQGTEDLNTAGTTILEAFQSETTGTIYTDIADIDQADAVVLVLAEKPAAEWFGDSDNLALNGKTGYQENVDLINLLAQTDKPVIVMLLSGKPLLVTDYIDSFDAYIMAFLPGTEGLGITDVLYGDHDFKGTLPYTYPRILSQATHTMLDLNYNANDYLFPYGFGLSYLT